MVMEKHCMWGSVSSFGDLRTARGSVDASDTRFVGQAAHAAEQHDPLSPYRIWCRHPQRAGTTLLVARPVDLMAMGIELRFCKALPSPSNIATIVASYATSEFDGQRGMLMDIGIM
jgi:hypothetical protein